MYIYIYTFKEGFGEYRYSLFHAWDVCAQIILWISPLNFCTIFFIFWESWFQSDPKDCSMRESWPAKILATKSARGDLFSV